MLQVITQQNFETNMSCIETIKKNFGLRVGYSDHTESNQCAVVAASMGASIFEKHFTLDKNEWTRSQS